MVLLKFTRPHYVVWAMLLYSLAFAQDSPPTKGQGHSLTVTISNVDPGRDANGGILDAHDGSLEFFDGQFYLYGTRYADSDGLSDSNRYVCYRSKDLVHWEFAGELLKDAPRRIYYRPYVKFNRLTHKYVLWYNADIRFGVATADRPAGPFTIQNPDVAVKYSSQGAGDFGLYVSEDGSGYIAYTALNLSQMNDGGSANLAHHRISVERLAPDYLSSTGENSGFIAGNVESPSLFKAKESTTCCLITRAHFVLVALALKCIRHAPSWGRTYTAGISTSTVRGRRVNLGPHRGAGESTRL